MTVINSVDEMRQLGQIFGQKLSPGDVILLSGPLGAGKTAFTQGVGAALNISNVTSPTFVISRIHEGKIPLIHVDAYRLQSESVALFDELDLESFLPSSITVVEWGEGLVDRLVSDFLEIEFEFGNHEDQRILTLTPHGDRFKELTL